MPTTLSGLLIFVVLIVPGLTHYVQRRARAPQRTTLSPVVETATLVTVSALCYSVVVVIFATFRILTPRHSPDVRRLVLEGAKYAAPRFGYLVGWGMGAIAIATVIAFLLGAQVGPIANVSRRFAPVIAETSAWYSVFESGPVGSYVHVGCDMRDGAFVSGRLAWYSTEVEEKADRDLALAQPITFRPAGGDKGDELTVPRMIISGREVTRMLVSYIGPSTEALAVAVAPSGLP